MENQALAGIRVADFTWFVAGPMTTRYISEHGAEVIKIESSSRIDPLRTGAPYGGGRPGINRSAYYADANRGKLSLGLNLSTIRGIELAKRLIATADIVTENFTPGTMEKWGLGYDELRKIKPDIIMFSTSQQGQTGPLAVHPALGTSLVSLAGFTHVTGWPDRPPTGLFGAYPDYISPPLAVAVIAAALDYRRRTGRGQHIDLSQYEASLLALAPFLLDYTANARENDRDGNRCDYAAPHGAFRCRGDDRWCAIAVSSDQEWREFCRVLGNPMWASEPRFVTLSGRKQNEADLERLIEEWTMDRSAEEIMALMQKAGVPAGVVQSSEDLRNDPQLMHREHLWILNHPEVGVHATTAPPFRFSKTPAKPGRPAPLLGEHNEYVCHKLLGMSDEEFVELLDAKVLE